MTKKDKQKSSSGGSKQVDPGHASRNIRETVESIVVAFVLAFLFRTFEAEAFVIPTGSMAPTLMGRHKDLDCNQCGYRYQVSASQEDSDEVKELKARRKAGERFYDLGGHGRQPIDDIIANYATATGTCPLCRWTQPVISLDNRMVKDIDVSGQEGQPSYSGDRIIVSKLSYTLGDPERWDVVVFRYPGEAQQNYIKRLIALPGETIRIEKGDIFILPPGKEKGSGGSEGDGFSITRKPPRKTWSMLHLVHDSRYFPLSLYEAEWPLRWSNWPTGAGGFKQEVVVEEHDGRSNAEQVFTIRGGEETAEIRYQHTVPSYLDWTKVAAGQSVSNQAVPRLITDIYAYNTDMPLAKIRSRDNGSLAPMAEKLGLHWVGDLAVGVTVEVEAATGELALDLVEGGKHFTCTIDLATGQARMQIDGIEAPLAEGETPLDSNGTYRLRFANVDDRLLLWVDGDLVDFGGPEGGAPYDAAEVFGARSDILPQTSEDDAGDLAPAGILARGASLSVRRMQLFRDIYYIADRYEPNRHGSITELSQRVVGLMTGGRSDLYNEALRSSLSEADFWQQFRGRAQEFSLVEDQYFVLGDNSPSSKDSRLWISGEDQLLGYENGIPRTATVKVPGGPYVERQLLTGKALFVYWPHSWGRVPGTPIPFPFFPNFGDMRVVR